MSSAGGRLYFPADKWLWRAGPAALLVDKRAAWASAIIALMIVLGGAIALSVGTTDIPLAVVVKAFLGQGEGVERMILTEIRLPRLLATLVAGYALGFAGAVSQTIFSNRLATPDILGINEGATLAIVSFVMLFGAPTWPFWIAPVGALLAVGVLYKIGAGGDVPGSVLLISGLCLAEFLRSIVEFMMSTGAMHEVQGIYIWMQGSFVGQGYGTTLPVLAILIVTWPAQAYLARHLELVRLPPELASGLGVATHGLKRLGVATVAVLAALGASIGGPVAFVAMAAPILAGRAVRYRVPAPWCAGLLGAALLAFADTLARTMASPEEIAAGVVTRVLGGCFLLYLLLKERVE